MSRKTKKLWKLTALLAVNLALLMLITSVCARAERLGSSGERVAEIQLELRKRKLLSGKINGVFDFRTRSAVADFQKMNGAESSGEVTYETLRLLGLDSRHSECFSAQAEMLARFIVMRGCRTYPEMLAEAEKIISETNCAITTGKYIGRNYSDFFAFDDEPSPEAYSAAIQAIRKSARF